ncbi:MAG: translation initiation factor IF-3, partial [Chloroflexi bacterium]|nr:translation initiation factor IF-3 [Chloroflexota bacterium]
MNREITASRVGVIGDQGQHLGVMTLIQALQAAQDLGLDLVEVSPTTVPPVCRILDYGKFRYLQNKKLKEARKNQKLSTVREVRFKTRIGEHDMASK